jgi:hypothetical protein
MLSSPLVTCSPAPFRPVSALNPVTGGRLAAAQHAPYRGELLELYKQCKAADRWVTVTAQVQHALQQGCVNQGHKQKHHSMK